MLHPYPALRLRLLTHRVAVAVAVAVESQTATVRKKIHSTYIVLVSQKNHGKKSTVAVELRSTVAVYCCGCGRNFDRKGGVCTGLEKPPCELFGLT